jgi:hypothetical protein
MALVVFAALTALFVAVVRVTTPTTDDTRPRWHTRRPR